MKSHYLFLLTSVMSIIICNSGSLFTTRVLSEFRDINRQGLSLNDPFNNSKSDCGIRLSPIKNNLQNWHFSFTGMEGSPFEGGIYHGVIKLHKDYPRKAPTVSMSTPSGRWKINEEICLSASSHHQEMWNPDWNLRTLVLSLRGFMLTPPLEIGGLMTGVGDRVRLATLSRNWVCPDCGVIHNTLLNGNNELKDVDSEINFCSQNQVQTPLTSVKKIKTRNISVKADTVAAAQRTIFSFCCKILLTLFP